MGASFSLGLASLSAAVVVHRVVAASRSHQGNAHISSRTLYVTYEPAFHPPRKLFIAATVPARSGLSNWLTHLETTASMSDLLLSWAHRHMAAAVKFHIVGIGASAGGVEALEGFFRGIATDTDMAFVVVTHLNPSRRTLLPEILARFTPLPVVQAAAGMVVEPRHVYVMPENSVLGIDTGHADATRSGGAPRAEAGGHLHERTRR
jgi:chemotaxis response regulator CheB